MAMEMKIIYQILIILTSLFFNICFADKNKIIIVNTDATVSRYQQIADEFKRTLPKNNYSFFDFDLKTNYNDEELLKTIIEKENPDFIYCIGGQAYILSQKIAKDKILLFSAALNWQRLNISEKTYGISNELLPEQDMTFLHSFFPQIKKIGVLYKGENNQEYIEKIKNSASSFNIEILAEQISSADDIDTKLTELLPTVELFWLIAEPAVLDNQNSVKKVFAITKQYQKPVYAYSDIYIKYGAILSVSFDTKTIGRQSAMQIMSLQQGHPPLPPVQAPAGSAITLNMCVVENLKVMLNKDSLDLVNYIEFCNTNEKN